jgi:hypothetical protein
MRILPLALLLTLVPVAATAQEAARTRGPEFALGAGFGTLRSYYEFDDSGENETESTATKTGAESFHGRALWPVSRKVMLGVEAYYGGGGESGRRIQDIGAMLAFRWAPNLDKGFTVRGGYGIVYSDIEPVSLEGEVIDGDLTGMLVSVGFGWNFPIGGSFSLEPMLRADIAPLGSFQPREDLLFGNIINTRYTIAVSLVWH